jgi:hypothetical protein
MIGNLVYSGKMVCRGCQVETAWHQSQLCPHCQQHWQCQECLGEYPWEALRFGMCQTCYPTKRFAYHLKKKERLCRTKS